MNLKHAGDYFCACCKEKAEVYWPLNDKDIKPQPYCMLCLRILKKEVRKLMKVCSQR